jgi:hypothetical protein
VAPVTPACICSQQHIVCSLSGPINDPSNRTLRRQLLAYGIDQFCTQMKERNVPLKLAEDQPVIGRFYPQQCTQQTLDNGDLSVQFHGQGYAWSAASKKLSFNAGAQVQYSQDFKCEGDDTMYAYFPVAMASNPPEFVPGVIEAPIASLVGNIVPSLVSQFGQTLLRSKLTEGFTVIRAPNGDTDFGLGLYQPPNRPQHPYNVPSGSALTYENLRVEVHQQERDFIGPIHVQEDGKALVVTLGVDGVPAIDVFVMGGDEGAGALSAYLAAQTAPPIPPAQLRPPPYTGMAQAGQPYNQTIPVSQGYWYVVLDNTSTAGVVNPPVSPLDDRAAVVNYVIQIGDAP